MAPRRGARLEFALQAAALALALVLAYGSARGVSLDYAYLAFAPTVWVALRGGLERAAPALLLVNVGAVLLVGSGPGGANPTLLQFGLLTLTLVGLLFGGLASDRRRAQARLAEQRDAKLRSQQQRIDELTTRIDRIERVTPGGLVVRLVRKMRGGGPA